MSIANLITIFVIVVSAMLEFLKIQTGVHFSPEVMLVLGVLSVGLNALARFLPAPNQPITVAIAGAPGQPGVAITETTPSGVTPTPAEPATGTGAPTETTEADRAEIYRG